MNHDPPSLEHVEGYCELGMWETAWKELDDLPSGLCCHPDVLGVRLRILTALGQSAKAVILGESLCQQWPERTDFQIATAKALVDEARTEEAILVLHAPPETAEKWFQIACLHARHGQLQKAKDALSRCFALDLEWRLRALDEPALAPLW